MAALLICVSLVSILGMNTRAFHTLRSTRQAAASSQLLQQRIEMIREHQWPEISNSKALKNLLRTATDSERELADTNLTEFIKVSAVEISSTGAFEEGRAFRVRRHRGRAYVDEAEDLGNEATLLFESSIEWRDLQGVRQRKLRTIVCRAGLTRSGIYGSALGRAGTATGGGTLGTSGR